MPSGQTETAEHDRALILSMSSVQFRWAFTLADVVLQHGKAARPGYTGMIGLYTREDGVIW